MIVGFALLFASCSRYPEHTIDWECVEGDGMVAPVPDCSATAPCTRVLDTYATDTLDGPAPPPSCGPSRTGLSDEGPRQWTDPDGRIRHWCEHRPPADGPLPLLLYVHGSGGSADTVYEATSLREKADTADLSGDGTRRGFVLVASHGRYLHWPTETKQDGAKHDSFYRDPDTNPDFRYLDHIVDSLVAEGVVDPERIHVSGWSNGARFGALYALTRHETPTVGGNRVAAAAVYSGGDPYANTTFDQEPSCAADPPASSLPFFMVGRSCDAVGCDTGQYDRFGRGLNGWKLVPGNVASAWIDRLRDEIGATDVTRVIVDSDGRPVDSCASTCLKAQALLNHVRWPDGVADGGGNDHEPAMLAFLRDHPLPDPPP